MKTFQRWLELTGVTYGNDGVGQPIQGTDDIDVIQRVIDELEGLDRNRWPIDPSPLQNLYDLLGNVGIQADEIDAAIGTTDPNLQRQHIQGALNNLKQMTQ